MMLPLLVASALAGTSADFELVRPAVRSDVPGLRTPVPGRPGQLYASAASWYTRNPLVLSEGGVEVGPVVRDRVATWAGVRLAMSRWLALEASGTFFAQTGGSIQGLSVDGVGAGDPTLGVDARLLQGRHLSGGGVRLDVGLPLGSPDRWMGDNGLRLMPSMYTSLRSARVQTVWELGLVLRNVVPGPENFVLGSELLGRAGIRLHLVDGVAVFAAAHTRADVNRLVDGRARVALESYGGLRTRLMPKLTLDVAAGRGLTGGYGTTDARVWAQLNIDLPERQPETQPELRVVRPAAVADDDLYEAIIAEPDPVALDEPEPTSDPLVLDVEGGRITLPATLQFAFGSSEIEPETRAELERVAAVLATHSELGHVVLEGHASWEGGLGYNYGLAEDRARAVFEVLVTRGIHPERLSWRSMGEVQPTAGAEPAHRRVELVVTRWTAGTLQTDVRRPWDGAPHEERR